ncbi:transmembrane protein 252-like [Anguilla anguilla]|uniref:transmembrane protein 252-like n=1 Tax=Anguilla anguilla TaxID=7936 RepID=UPI0015AC1226|nr:transmembrane protein 252-like [Anguilla anguilla]
MDLRKSVRKTLLTLARAALPTLGFGFTCLGAFLLSTRGAGNSCAPYICIVLGFVLLTAGVVWTICVSVRSRVLRQRQGTSRICTVDRPDFYPPSYEESLDRDTNAVTPNPVEPRHTIAPPLYTASITEVPSEDYSLEEPPSYGEAILQGRSHPDTPPASPTPGATLPGAPIDRH